MASTMETIKGIFFSGNGLQVKYSSMHLIMPTIVIAIMTFLAVVMLIQRALRCKKNGTPFIRVKGYRFFSKDFDPWVFFSTILLTLAYFFLMPKMGFLLASIVFLFLFNVLFTRPFDFQHKRGTETVQAKSLAVSAIISIAGPLLIWFLFGVVFKLTLP